MERTQVSIGGLVLAAALAMSLTSCGDDGDLAFQNEGPGDVSVVSDRETFTVEADGGVVLLESGCTDGDVEVTFPSGQTVTVTGPVCPDKTVVIHDEQVDLRTP